MRPTLQTLEQPMSDAYIIDACRTPRGIGRKTGKGALADFHPQHLAPPC